MEFVWSGVFTCYLGFGIGFVVEDARWFAFGMIVGLLEIGYAIFHLGIS